MTAPVQVDEDLVAKAREVARSQGGLPSGRRLRAALGVGSDKAKAVLDRLDAERRERAADRRRAMKAIERRGSSGRRLRHSLTRPRTGPEPALTPRPPAPPVPASSQVVAVAAEVGAAPAQAVEVRPEPVARKVVTWPALVVAAPAFVAIWAGWVALGKLTGFGRINVLPGFGEGLVIDTAITLPIGVEAYAAYAFYVWLHPASPPRARLFAAVSSGLAVALGMGGQTAYHLMAAAQMTAAPWQITTVVSCLPVAVFGLACTLIHLVRAGHDEKDR